MQEWRSLAHAGSEADLVMPDLRQLPARQVAAMAAIGVFFTGHGVPGIPGSHAHAHFKNYIRLVFKAVREYEAARETLIVFIETKNENLGAIIDLTIAVDHLETCFN